MSIGIIHARVSNNWLSRNIHKRSTPAPSQRMRWRRRQSDRIANEFLKLQTARHSTHRLRYERKLQLSLAQPAEQFVRGQVVQLYAHMGQLRLECAQRRRQNARGERRRITDV